MSKDEKLVKSDVVSHISELSSDETLNSDPNPFADPVVASYYRNLYEETKYESRLAFDPDVEWTKEEEKKLLRKLDWRVSLTSCICFFALQIDRGNMGQVVADNFLGDLGLTTNDYNTANTIFLVCFLAAELPSQYLSKKFGPDRFLPVQILLWSVIAMSQAAIKSKASYFVLRGLLAILEGGFIADLVLWLSYFYKGSELSVRLSFFWVALSITQIVSALGAFGILRLRSVPVELSNGGNGHGLYSGWQYIFLIYGAISFLIGLYSIYALVPSVVQTENKLHKSWFTKREEIIAVNRILRDDPSKGDMNNRQPLSLKQIWKSLIDYDLWPIYGLGIIFGVPTSTASTYLTLTLKTLGFSSLNVNLLTIPASVIHIILLLVITKASEVLKDRSFVCLSLPLYELPLLGVMAWWSGIITETWPTWVVVTLFLGAPYIHAINVAWASRNSFSVRTRSVSSALYNMFVQVGAIISSNIYREDDKPLYRRGNLVLFAVAALVFFYLLFMKWYYVTRNRKREERWNKMTPEERENYVKNTTDEGNKRLDFRFDH